MQNLHCRSYGGLARSCWSKSQGLFILSIYIFGGRQFDTRSLSLVRERGCHRVYKLRAFLCVACSPSWPLARQQLWGGAFVGDPLCCGLVRFSLFLVPAFISVRGLFSV